MTAHRLIVRVLPDGTVRAETEGVTGSACLDYISLLEDLVSGQTVTSEFTADYLRNEDHTAVAQASAQVPVNAQPTQPQGGAR